MLASAVAYEGMSIKDVLVTTGSVVDVVLVVTPLVVDVVADVDEDVVVGAAVVVVGEHIC